MIEANELPLAPDDIEEWPRPVRLHVLGGVSLEQPRVPAANNNQRKQRSARRPMELLLFLVAHSGGPVATNAALKAEHWRWARS